MSASTLELIGAVDRLLERAADSLVDEATVAEWMESLPQGIDRKQAKALRRAARLAVKMSRSPVEDDDWRRVVDGTLGSAGWQPTLDLAQHGLDVHPSAEVFAEAQSRFRLVYLRPWLEGVSFEEYMVDRSVV